MTSRRALVADALATDRNVTASDHDVGRPTREETASTIIVTFRITQEEKRLLDEIASRRNASVSDVLRALIRKEAARLDPSRDER